MHQRALQMTSFGPVTNLGPIKVGHCRSTYSSGQFGSLILNEIMDFTFFITQTAI